VPMRAASNDFPFRSVCGLLAVASVWATPWHLYAKRGQRSHEPKPEVSIAFNLIAESDHLISQHVICLVNRLEINY
jgi:hypothetical protein